MRDRIVDVRACIHRSSRFQLESLPGRRRSRPRRRPVEVLQLDVGRSESDRRPLLRDRPRRRSLEVALPPPSVVEREGRRRDQHHGNGDPSRAGLRRRIDLSGGPGRRRGGDHGGIGGSLQLGGQEDDGLREGPLQGSTELRASVRDAPEGPAAAVDHGAAVPAGSPAPEEDPRGAAVRIPPDIETRHEGGRRPRRVLVVVALVQLAEPGGLLRAQKRLDLVPVRPRKVNDGGPVVVLRGADLPAADPLVVGRPAEVIGLLRRRIVVKPEGSAVPGFGGPETPVDAGGHDLRPDVGVADPVVPLGYRDDGGADFGGGLGPLLVFQHA
mmetsp:Transcript_8060/g.20055  ORF Transcript_8060/g.20055 Transcript_8060/m.20055 type:complete len:327 (-) Transcript_8060:472-1452(-)